MTATQLHNLTSPNKEMPGDVFDSLMEKSKLEHGSDTDYYFKSKHGNYEILFGTDGEHISIDTFGFKHNKGWLELQPTDKQINAMKRKIESVPDRIEDRTDEYKDPYLDNGVSRNDFYNF